MTSISNKLGERFLFLDALRGLTIIWIAIYHMTFQSFSPQPTLDIPIWITPYIGDATYGGVFLFFILSAFSLCSTMTVHQIESKPLIRFYIRRFFRIAPLFYAFLIYQVLQDAVKSGITHSIFEIAINILFVFNIIPEMNQGIIWASWFMGVIMLFYLFFPLFHKFFNDTWKTATFIIWSILIAYIFQFAINFFPAALNAFFPYFRCSFLRNLPLFAFGMFSFYLLRTPFMQKLNIKVVGIFLIGTALLSYFYLLNGMFNILDPYYMKGIILTALVVGLALNPLKIVVNKITTFLGKISYSMYLCHPPLIHLVLNPLYPHIYILQIPLLLKFLLCAGVTITLLVGVSIITYRFIEKPGIRLGKKFLKSRI
jgi:peptidoglycan/LPS O-acetylase OafA/YrhL